MSVSNMSEIQYNIARLKPFSDFYYSDSNHGGELLRVLNELRKTKTFCNVFLKTRSEHHGLAVHREVLVAFSPYFKELFENDSVTEELKEILLEELSPGTLVLIIDYLYTGAITLTTENAQDIFDAASLMKLKTLRELSESYLIKSISTGNCLKMMSLAQRWNSHQLLENARLCMGANFAKVIESRDFFSMEAKDLKAVISSDDLVVTSENEVYEAVKRWIESNHEQRLKYVPLLMSQVRFRFLPRDFLTTKYKHDSIVSLSPLCEDFVHEALMYDRLSSEEQQRVHTARVIERWCMLSTEMLLLIGGTSPEENNSQQWAFDPVTSEWYSISPLQSSRHLFGIAQCESGLYVFGGLKNMKEDTFLTTIEMYDPKLNKWNSVKKTMREARCRFDAVSIGEMVYFVGGMCNDPHQNTLEMYNPIMNVDGVKISAPKLPRYDHCTTVLDGKIYFIGGYTRGNKALNEVECYDPDKNTWSEVAPLLVPRTGACAVTIDGSIIVIGGTNSKKPLSSCEIYDKNKNRWDFMSPMNERRDHCTAACFNNKVYVFGGSYGRVAQNSVECYSPKTNKWRVVSHLPAAKHGFKCVKSVVNRALVRHVGFEQV